MRNQIILPLLVAGTMLAGCNGGQQQQTEERVVEFVDSATGIITLRDYEVTDTITIGGKIYEYTYGLQHIDSMGVVINPQGLEYKESKVSVSVKCGDKDVFSRTYYKKDLASYVPSDKIDSYTMIGVNYNFTKRDEDRSALYFIVTVGDPDETSDEAYPLELKVMPDGSNSLSKARNLDTETLNPSLNVDPGTDEGV